MKLLWPPGPFLRITLGMLVIVSAVAVLSIAQTACLSSFGGSPKGERLTRIQASPQFHGGKLENSPAVPMIVPGTYMQMLNRQLFGSEQRVPTKPIPVVAREKITFAEPPLPGLRAIWLGHATSIVEIDGVRLLTDPVFADRVSPFTSVGPSRFFQPPIPLEDLPRIDAVIVSHDHYDHLDMSTAKFLAARGTKYFVPLGIGAHLEAWGVPVDQIIELDWWESRRIGSVEIFCTPAVHYSGRGLMSGNSTLWSSWAVVGSKNRFYHSGDSGFPPHFENIGGRLGPFDLTSIKVGAYDWTWEGIHMNPEDAVKAHKALRGRRMLPIHWGTFNLAIHAWDEPIERAKSAATADGVDMVTPRPGDLVDAALPFASVDWWAALK